MCRFPLKSNLFFPAFFPLFILLGLVVGQRWKTEHLVKESIPNGDCGWIWSISLKNSCIRTQSFCASAIWTLGFFFNHTFLFYDCYALLLYFNKMSAAKCWLKQYTVKLFERTWQAASSVTLCGGRGSLSPDLPLSPWSQVTICLHNIASAHGAIKRWQNPCLFSGELRTLVNHLKSVFAPSSTTKATEDRQYSLWQLKAVSIYSQSFPPNTMKSLEKKNKFGFPEEDNRMPALYLSCWYAIEVSVLV